MNNDELMIELGKLLREDKDINATPWIDLVLVVQFKPSSIQVNGFAYQADGTAIPTSPEGFAVTKQCMALRDAMQELGKEPWKACLIRLNKSSGSMDVDFECERPERWLILPTTVKHMAEMLRPVHDSHD